MLFGTRHQLINMGEIKILYRNHKLEQVSSFKYLGVVSDSKLTFAAHVEHLKSKKYAKIRILGRVRHVLDQGTALTLYKTLILPIYDNCDYITVLMELTRGITETTKLCLPHNPRSELFY